MAVTRESVTGILIIFMFGFVIRCNVNCLQCLSQENKPVDWFIAYKLSYHQKDIPHDSFYYMDAQSTKWKFSGKTMKDKGQAIYNTLEQIYKTYSKNSSSSDADILYVMYNDEHPKPKNMHKLQSQSILKGHTKGVIGFDKQKGFWLIHSIPGFPPIRTKGYDLQNKTYGQTFLCISMATDTNLDEIGSQLLYYYPDIYDKSPPSSFASKFPNMVRAMKGNHVTGYQRYRETKLTSANGVAFHSFAKSAYFNQDLYSDLLAPRFKSTLQVQSWQKGRGEKMASNCTSKYKVFNIESMQFGQQAMGFKSTTDHSKWAITNCTCSAWICIGDINRMYSQEKRGGGATCFQNKEVWNNFNSMIKSYHPCGQ